MVRRLLYILIVTFSISCTSVKTYNEQISVSHSIPDMHKDVDKAYKKLQKLHPKLYGYITKEKLDFKFDSLKKTIDKPLKTKEFYEKLAPVIAEVRQGHIGVNFPKLRLEKEKKEYLKKKKFEFNELDFEYIDEGLWLTNTRGQDSSIVGSQLLKVAGEEVTDIFKKQRKLIAADGYNETFYNRIIAHRFSGYLHKDRGFIDSLSVVMKKNDSVFTRVFRYIAKDSFQKKKVDTAKVKPIVLTKLERKELKSKRKKIHKENIKYGYSKKRKEYTRSFNFIGKDSSIAYMKIREFSGSYKEFFEESFTKLDSAKTKNLILDLRNNPGGSIAQITKLYSYLTPKEFKMVNESEVLTRGTLLKSMMSYNNPLFVKIIGGIFSPAFITYDLIKTHKKDGKLYYKLSFSKSKEPNPLRYDGKLYVIINGASFSASSILSANLKGSKRATIIGEETGGAYNGTVAGLFKYIKLPTSKVRIRIGLMQVDGPYKVTPDGYGVQPDVKILPKLEDRLNGKDTHVQWILNAIENN